MKILLYIISIFLLCDVSFSQITQKVLFLGNSYTGVNNLPQMLADIALSAGDNIVFDSNTPGGHTLDQHSVNPISLNKIMLGNWDYVVLQEQSQIPSIDYYRYTYMYPAAHRLKDSILKYNPCAKVMTYMTWGRKNGGQQCGVNNTYCSPFFVDYNHMQDSLTNAYIQISNQIEAEISPVGSVWKSIRQNQPQIELFQPDDSHPSLAGSYAAACSFYTALFRKNPMSINSNIGLTSLEANSIKSIIKSVVYDNMSNWNIGNYDPMASFNSTYNLNSVVFNNTSSYSSVYSWDFGDGNTSASSNPTHTYLTGGNYMVTLIASHCEDADTVSQSININTSQIEAINLNSNVYCLPNPFANHTTIFIGDVAFQNATLTVLNHKGECILTLSNLNEQSITLDTRALADGLYFIQIVNGYDRTLTKIIKIN